MRLNDKSTDITTYVATLSGDLAKNPLIQLEYAIALYEEGNLDQALPIFTAIHEFDPSVDWAIEAGEYIRTIESRKNQSGSLQQ